jgi:hypothetical protein
VFPFHPRLGAQIPFPRGEGGCSIAGRRFCVNGTQHLQLGHNLRQPLDVIPEGHLTPLLLLDEQLLADATAEVEHQAEIVGELRQLGAIE